MYVAPPPLIALFFLFLGAKLCVLSAAPWEVMHVQSTRHSIPITTWQGPENKWSIAEQARLGEWDAVMEAVNDYPPLVLQYQLGKKVKRLRCVTMHKQPKHGRVLFV